MATQADIILKGLDAAKPTLDAYQDGILWYSTDTQRLYRWNGSTLAWDQIAPGTAGTGGWGDLADDSVTNAKLAEMTAKTFKGRHTNSTGNPEDVSVTDLTSDLNQFTGDSGSGGVKGLVPAPAAGDAAASKYLAAGGGWSTPSGTGAPADAKYLTAQAEGGLSAEQNIGALTEGVLYTTPTAGVAAVTSKAIGASSGNVAAGDHGHATLFTNNVSATDKVLGRSSSGAGVVEEISCTAAGRAILDDANAAAQRVTMGVASGGVLLTFGDGVSAITTSEPVQEIPFPFAATLTSWDMWADASGSIELYIWSRTYAEEDAGSTHPVAGDSIVASTPPALTSDQKQTDTDLTDWTEAVAEGDILRVGVTSAATVKRVWFWLHFTR